MIPRLANYRSAVSAAAVVDRIETAGGEAIVCLIIPRERPTGSQTNLSARINEALRLLFRVNQPDRKINRSVGADSA